MDRHLVKSIDPLTAVLAIATVAFTAVVSVLKYIKNVGFLFWWKPEAVNLS